MPIVRKILQHGTSKAVTIPKSWLDLIERTTGKEVMEVSMEINGVIIIAPLFKREA